LNLSSLKAYRVAKYLLKNRVSSQSNISKETRVAIGYVNEVIHELFDQNIVTIEYGKCSLVDYVRLLEKIGFDRPFNKLRITDFRLPTRTITETEERLATFCDNRGIRYAFSVFSGLKHYYEYHISYPTVHIYVDKPSELFEMEKGEGVIPVVVLYEDRPDIFNESSTMKNRHVCDEIQIIIDLFTSGIGRNAAIKYYRDSIWNTEKS
jgi:hypothetical protein